MLRPLTASLCLLAPAAHAQQRVEPAEIPEPVRATVEQLIEQGLKDVVFETASPFDTPRLMGELVQWANDNLESGELHKLIVIAIFVVVFLAIHPFQDGNGRLSRVLTTLLLLRSGYDYVPYSSLESIIEQNKDSYRYDFSTLKEKGPTEKL